MSVTLHTSHGDVKVELFCDLAPSTCEVPPASPDLPTLTAIRVRALSAGIH
jgi:hypothetical protein